MALKFPEGFGIRFLTLFGVGFLGILSLPFILLAQLRNLPAQVSVSPIELAILSLIQPTILLAIAVAMGTFFAPKVGFRSHIANQVAQGKAMLPRLKREFPLAAIAGALIGIAIIILDSFFRLGLGELGDRLAIVQPRTLATTMAGILYGGITEELLMRWGLMTLFVWIGWRLLQRRQGKPHPILVWVAIIAIAIIFGLGHLPVVAAVVPLTPLIITRTIFLNAMGGVIFGWLYWRRSLESAMIAHASTHVCFSLVAGLLSAFS
ncbi:MAG: CPBP family glutamic-type intramembrane protease [Desertifilum sp.]|nr:CPBP family glutamic-type intramembrane protease [Desertifilum sp.]